MGHIVVFRDGGGGKGIGGGCIGIVLLILAVMRLVAGVFIGRNFDAMIQWVR